MGALKPHSNGPLYSNTVIGTLAVDGWAVTFGTARWGLGGLWPRPVPSSLLIRLMTRRYTNFSSMYTYYSVPFSYGTVATSAHQCYSLFYASADYAQRRLLCSHCVPLFRCPVPTWTRPQGGRVHYIHGAAEASYDRDERSFAL